LNIARLALQYASLELRRYETSSTHAHAHHKYSVRGISGIKSCREVQQTKTGYFL